MNDMKIANFDSWEEVTKGIYRNPVSAGCAYEIVLIHFPHDTNILDAEAELYIAGEWHDNSTKEDYYGRDLLDCGTVQECLEAAAHDYKEMME